MNLDRWKLAEIIHTARIKLAWGAAWETRKQRWPRTAKELRAYKHSPVAEMDLALAEADAVIEWVKDELDNRDFRTWVAGD